jgi:hypothetical protein
MFRLFVGKLRNGVEGVDSLFFGDAGFLRDRSGDLRFGHCFGHSLFGVCCYLVLQKSYDLARINAVPRIRASRKSQKCHENSGVLRHCP